MICLAFVISLLALLLRSLPFLPCCLLKKALSLVRRLCPILLILLEFSRRSWARFPNGFLSGSALVLLFWAFSWAGSGCGALWAAEASWLSSHNSGTWEKYQGHDCVVVVAKYKPKNTTITNSQLIGVSTTNVPIRNYAQYSSGAGFYYVQDSVENTISFFSLYCPDLDTIITYGPVSGTGGNRIKNDIVSSKWYKQRKAKEPVTIKLIDTSVIAGLLLQVLKGWFTSALGIVFTLFFLLRGVFALRDFLNGVQADRAAKWIEQQEKLNGTHRYRRFRNKKALFNHLEKTYKEDVLK